ncbi:Hypothetical predicted protein, partial [Pelobates cultripes]
MVQLPATQQTGLNYPDPNIRFMQWLDEVFTRSMATGYAAPKAGGGSTGHSLPKSTDGTSYWLPWTEVQMGHSSTTLATWTEDIWQQQATRTFHLTLA